MQLLHEIDVEVLRWWWCRACSGRLSAVHNWAAPVRTHGSRRGAATRHTAGGGTPGHPTRAPPREHRPLHSPAPPTALAGTLQQLAGHGAASPARTTPASVQISVHRYLVCWGWALGGGLGWWAAPRGGRCGLAGLGWAGLCSSCLQHRLTASPAARTPAHTGSSPAGAPARR